MTEARRKLPDNAVCVIPTWEDEEPCYSCVLAGRCLAVETSDANPGDGIRRTSAANS